MKVLVACEYSGIVRDAFTRRGHEAWSCDILPSETIGKHFQGDIREFKFLEQFDLLIGHPPCTYITNAGVRHLHEHCTSRNGNRAKVFGDARRLEMVKACEFFNWLVAAPVKRICIENPVPHKYARELIGRYTQLIQPWMFGHGETKATCFWLENLPILQPTHRRDDLFCKQEPSERVQRVHFMAPGPDRAKERSRFFPGIAKAMAEQWGSL